MSGSLRHARGCLAGMGGCALSSHERFIASTVDFMTERMFRQQQSACRPVWPCHSSQFRPRLRSGTRAPMQRAGDTKLRVQQQEKQSEAVCRGEAQIRWLCKQRCPMLPSHVIWHPATRQLPNAWVHEAKGRSPQRHCGRSQAVLSDTKETVLIPGKERSRSERAGWPSKTT